MTAEDQVPQRNAGRKHNRRGEQWDSAFERIHREMPSTRDGSWVLTMPEESLFRLIGILGRPLGELRPEPSPEEVARSVDTIFRKGLGVGGGQIDEAECTNLPFVRAFQALKGGRTLMQLFHRTGIQQNRIHRLLRGVQEPTGVDMEAIAGGFGKQPWYFREYRSTLIAAAVLARMDQDPNRSARIVREIAS